MSLEEWQALAQFEAGRCFVELDKKPQAINALQTVINKHPDHPKAKDAAALINKLKECLALNSMMPNHNRSSQETAI